MIKASLAVVSLFILLYILPLSVRPLAIPDESRYAEIPREMIASGDWVVPRLAGLRYFEKPVLGYWLNALAMTLCGENAFAARLPSALSVGCSALMLFVLVRRSAGSDLALASAAVFLTCLEVFAVGVFSVLDSMFSAFVTATMAGFFLAYREPRTATKALYLVLSGLACGLAFLTKGFLAFALPVVVIFPFLLWERRWKALLSYTWVPLLVAVLTILPWGLWIYAREKDFWRYFFWEEHIRRFLSDNAQHAEPVWYFIPFLLAGALPWTLLSGGAIKGLRARLQDPLIRFSIVWLASVFIFFSASSGKLATYILPCFPPLAVLLAAGVAAHLSNCERKGCRRVVCLSAAAIVILAIVVLLIHAIPNGARIYGPAETWKWLVMAGGLLIYATILVISETQTAPLKKVAFWCAGPAVLMFSTAFLIPDRLTATKAPEAFLQRYASDIRPDTLIVTDDTLGPAVCWTYKRQDVFFLNKGGEMTYGLGYDDSKHRLLTIDGFNALVAEGSRAGRIVLIIRARSYSQWSQQLTKPQAIDTNGHFVFARFSDP